MYKRERNTDSGIFSSTLVYYRFSEEDRVFSGGGTLKYFVSGAHIPKGVKYFGNNFYVFHSGRESSLRRHHGRRRAEKF